MNRLEDFFSDLDGSWSYERGTKDSDVFETLSLTKEIQARLLALAGRG